MLLQSNVRMDGAVTRRAIDEAKRRGESLVVLAVLDSAIPEKVASQFGESGHMGPRPSEGFLRSLYERHEQLALQQAQDIVGDAEASGIEAVPPNAR